MKNKNKELDYEVVYKIIKSVFVSARTKEEAMNKALIKLPEDVVEYIDQNAEILYIRQY